MSPRATASEQAGVAAPASVENAAMRSSRPKVPEEEAETRPSPAASPSHAAVCRRSTLQSPVEGAMSWVALVGPEIEENLSLRYLASSLARAGYRSEILGFNGDNDFGRVLAAILDADEAPVVVGISLAFQWRARDFLALAMALREGGYTGHITTGGHFGTFACKEVLAEFDEVDSVCRQEAEETLVALVRAVENGTPLSAIAGLAYREKTADGPDEVRLTCLPTMPDLASLPRPDRRGAPAACFDHAIAPIVSSRGCYANCTFCCIAAWHEQTMPGKRYRVRDIGDVADEMVAMQRERNVEVFVFHDDNFFLPGHSKNLVRINALADALEERGIGRYATVVKARPTDADPAVFRALVERLHCIRTYVGIETDADQGLETLNRWAQSRHNHATIALARELDLYTCFNLLLFDPDTTVESLETNISFIEAAPEFAFNFGRVELYAGTPLLQRMLAEGRCTGDWMQWDYKLHDPAVERIFDLTMKLFHPRNFGDGALANHLMGTRFDAEVCRYFHPDVWRKSWGDEAKDLSRALSTDTAQSLRKILAHVTANEARTDRAFVRALAPELRAAEEVIGERARDFARAMQAAIGRGAPLTILGDRVATPLQTQRRAESSLVSSGEVV